MTGGKASTSHKSTARRVQHFNPREFTDIALEFI